VALAAAATALTLGALGWLWFAQRSAGGHWEAVDRGRAYLQQGRPDLALGAVMDVRDEAPGASEAMTVAGLALIQMRQFQGARLTLERAVKLKPDQYEAVKTLARLNLAVGNGQRALELLEAAAKLRPRDFDVWLAMARLLGDRGDNSRAIYVYEKAVELNPADREALIGLIGAQLRSERPGQAETYVARALQRYPDDPTVLGLAARAADNANRYEEAISLADRSLARQPPNVHALLARAMARVARSRWDDALPDAEAAAAAQPNDLEALNLLLKIEMHLKLTRRAAATLARRERAQERLKQMNALAMEIMSHPEDPQYPWRIGELAAESGQAEMASRCFMAALALDDQYKPAIESLARLRAAHPELAPPAGRPITRPAMAGGSLSSLGTFP
jgi:tetratricopeptide (TPR) repeat protein